MSYQNVTFPEMKLIHGTSKTRDDNTVVFGNGYKEYRIRRSSIDPLTWVFPPRDLRVHDARELINFYNQVDGGLDSFNFKDPDDYQWDRFQLKNLQDDDWEVVSLSGSPIAVGSITQVHQDGNSVGPRTIQTTANGTPYITVFGSTSNQTIDITGTFFYVVRFDGGLNYSYNALGLDNETVVVGIDSFALKEVAEYA